MTETTPLITANPMRGLKKVGSVEYPWWERRLVSSIHQPENLSPWASPAKSSSRAHRSLRDYHNKPEENANSFRNTGFTQAMSLRWMKTATSHRGQAQRHGQRLRLQGFYPCCRRHPYGASDIDMAATIGIPDPKRPGSEIVASAIKLKPGIERAMPSGRSLWST